MTTAVIFFKEPDENYHNVFASQGVESVFIPTLDEKLELEGLEKILSRASEIDYWGIISTSKRSSLAFKNAFLNQKALLAPENEKYLSKWTDLTFFSVGKATSLPFTALNCRVEGAKESVNAASLSKFIVKFVSELDSDSKHKLKNKRLLFLIGDKTRKEINDTLTENDISFDTLQVYKTFPQSNIALSIKQIQSRSFHNIWFVFFSPSGVDVVLPLLEGAPFMKLVKIAAIGKTTQAHLLKKNIEVSAVPETPTPESLAFSMLNSV